MKNKIIFLLFVLSSSLYGQGIKFTVSGVVTDCKTKLALIDFPVKIVCSNGNVVETKTDVNGKYIIELQHVKLPLSCVVVFYTADNPISCIYTGEKTKFTIEDSLITNRTENMCLVNMAKLESKTIPIPYFKKNNFTNYFFEDNIEGMPFILKILKDNPNIVVEIGGHSSKDEKKPQELGQKRAELIKAMLVKEGIDPERLVVKSFSDNLPVEISSNDGQILKAPYQKNRRVTLAVLRKDYIPKQK